VGSNPTLSAKQSAFMLRISEGSGTVLRRRGVCVFCFAVSVLVVCALHAVTALAQTYPLRPVRLVVPYPPGGATDFTAREISQALTEAMGQQFVVDNRSGAGGTVGHYLVTKAAPDGYTLVVGTFGGLVTGPALLGPQVPYDPERDFVPIGLVVHTPWALVVNPNVPAKTVKELIDLAKAAPGKLSYASTGTGTPNHLGMVLLLIHAGINMVHVPYRSAGQITVDLISGQVQSVFSGVPQILPHVKTGRLRVIGVGHPTRLNALPDVPAIAETVPGFNNSGYYGLLAPLGTPRPLVDKINGELRKAFGTPDMARRLEGNGLVATTSTPEEFGALIHKDLALWRKVIKSAGVMPE
jgi:tripartite-type tricarboxylate transporter receptor subunit TctC